MLIVVSTFRRSRINELTMNQMKLNHTEQVQIEVTEEKEIQNNHLLVGAVEGHIQDQDPSHLDLGQKVTHMKKKDPCYLNH